MFLESTSSLLALRLPPSPMTRRLVGLGAMGAVVLVWWIATFGIGGSCATVVSFVVGAG